MKKLSVIFLIPALNLFSCGIETFLFLPQVPEVRTEFVTRATVDLPSISGQDFFYSTGFTIFYKIYISDHPVSSIDHEDDLSHIHQTLLADYRALFPFIDPINTTAAATIATFTNRNFHELDVSTERATRDNFIVPTMHISEVLLRSGGSLRIHFPEPSGESPYLEINDTKYYLYRSHEESLYPLRAFRPLPEHRLFFNAPELSSFENATSTINADVAGRQNIIFEDSHVYVAMYIAAEGRNPGDVSPPFIRFIGKPTYIGVFKLPLEF
jgi:hypothetical protein